MGGLFRLFSFHFVTAVPEPSPFLYVVFFHFYFLLFLLYFLLSFFLSFSVESSPALQTSSMLDCLATIQAIISFLQKSNSEQRLCNLFDKMAFCCIETKNVDDDGSGCGITCQAVHETKRSWKELMKQIFFDLCAVLFDGTCHILLLSCV